MDPDRRKLFEKLKTQGLSSEQKRRYLAEFNDADAHAPVDGAASAAWPESPLRFPNLYTGNDLELLQSMASHYSPYTTGLSSVDELLERDKQREQDGFPRKIRVGRLIKPGKSGKDKVVVVPTTVEEKFIHDMSFQQEGEGGASGGIGEGEEGDVIGEQPVRPEGEGSGAGPGEGEGGKHEMESSAYDLGRILSEQFELPNLKDKGKKRSLTRYTYDMTDRNRGFGQFLDKKATLRKILETNIHLGNVPDVNAIDPSRFLISPSDKIYRILSREKDYESQAMVFFLRDYSGSMGGKPTELVVAQHVMIYSWLLYQYEKQVESRFILHDTEATEVPDFYTYYNSKVAGGTKVVSAFRMVNEIVEKENLVRDYNIYVFHGTDGDDWDTEGKETVPEIKKTLAYTNRVGITVVQHTSGSDTQMQKYMTQSGILLEKPKLIRMDVVSKGADEPRLIQGIKKLISE
jgi:uncharacterized protein